MKVTQVSIRPSQASQEAGRPALTPELLAASGARYSRNNEGLEAILSKIDPANLEKSVDSIFKMVDYGHQSIADMAPVAMFIDNVSIWLAYYVWTLCPTAGGQESSTRYIKISPEGLVPPEQLGIPAEDLPAWRESMDQCFSSYQAALVFWENLAFENPSLMGIPSSLLKDQSEGAQKRVMRMKRNYAFDRARYFLPVAASTNVMLVMSARGWVALCQNLLSHALPEPRKLGEMIREELRLSAPRMIRHATASEAVRAHLEREFQKCRDMSPADAPAGRPLLSVEVPAGLSQEELAADLGSHPNRYAPMGSGLQRMTVRFGWSAIGFAEIRDLNRHRTGTKYSPQVPSGFYFAADQLGQSAGAAQLNELSESGTHAGAKALEFLRAGQPSYIYWSLLGTEFPFEHVTTADKFIYEAELRTGLGAHFRYAKHLRDVLGLFYQKFPLLKGKILEGSAEPE